VYLRGAQWVLPGNWQMLASSAGVLMVLLMVPDGLVGVWTRARNQLIAALIGRPVDERDRVEPSDDPTPSRLSRAEWPDGFHHEAPESVFVAPEGVIA